MSKLRRILLAAAALVTGSAMALGLALTTANEAEVSPLTGKQWVAAIERTEQQGTLTYFVAIQNGYSIPAASSGYILGDCGSDKCGAGYCDPFSQTCAGSGGGACETSDDCGMCGREDKACGANSECAITACDVKADSHPRTLTYPYRIGGLVNGWRLARVTSPRYFALGWKQLASEAAEVRFYKSYADVVTSCLANFTPVQCRNLVSGVSECWLNTSDGSYCRYGLTYAVGVGGVNPDGSPATCTVGVNHVPFPCSDEGRGQAWAAQAPTEAWPDDADLELPE